MTTEQIPEFQERLEKALGDEHLKGALRYTTEKLYKGRLGAMADLNEKAGEGLAIGTFPELRRRAREIKEHTLQNLDYYLQQASESIEKAGGQVYYAVDAHEVVKLVSEICHKKHAQLVVKSKSMASEEVHLNHALEDQGMRVVESDLGEFIIQLAHEKPAHIVIPAIQKTRSQISDLFSELGGERLPTDTPTLTAFARRTLRKIFMSADIGITGANFVAAETGTLCMVTNEGNGRMTSSVPRVQIAIVGIEKVVPRLEDVGVLYSLLPRSATGQKITTYFNMMTGPRHKGDADGPEELHVIFMDNGRTNMLGTEYDEALYCIRCGACMNACPVYRNIGGHAYGGTYPGPIGAVITPLLEGLDTWEDLPNVCSLCGACHEVCPVGIHLHEHLINLRHREVTERREHWFMRVAMKMWMWAWTKPAIYRLSAKIAHMAMKPRTKQTPTGRNVVETMPFPLSLWTDTRNLSSAVERPFHERWADLEGGEE